MNYENEQQVPVAEFPFDEIDKAGAGELRLAAIEGYSFAQAQFRAVLQAKLRNEAWPGWMAAYSVSSGFLSIEAAAIHFGVTKRSIQRHLPDVRRKIVVALKDNPRPF